MAEKATFDASAMCEALAASSSAYYEWEREQEPEHACRDQHLEARIQALFPEFQGRYGLPRSLGAPWENWRGPSWIDTKPSRFQPTASSQVCGAATGERAGGRSARGIKQRSS